MLVSASASDVIMLWDPSKLFQQSGLLVGHTDEVNALVECAGKLASASNDHTIKIWGTQMWKCEHTLKGHEDRVLDLVQIAGKLASASRDHTIRVWDTTTWECEGELKDHTDAPEALAVVDGKLASGAGADDSAIRIWGAERA